MTVMRYQDALDFHRENTVIDLHADTAKLMAFGKYDFGVRHKALPGLLNVAGQVDLPRLRDAAVSGQFFGLWTVPFPQRGCARSIHRQIDALEEAANLHTDFRIASTEEELTSINNEGAIAAFTGIEGGHALEGKIENVEAFYKRGVSYIGLLHFTPNQLGTPAKSILPSRLLGALSNRDKEAGLTSFGKAVVDEMNRLKMIVDLAHINRPGFFQAIERCNQPVFVSHTGVTGVHPHWRNIDDDQLRAVAKNQGSVGIIFSRPFIGGNSVEVIADHLLHIVKVAGEDTPALGSDFDGCILPPKEMPDIGSLPIITQALSNRGLHPRIIAKILGGNAKRVLKESRS